VKTTSNLGDIGSRSRIALLVCETSRVRYSGRDINFRERYTGFTTSDKCAFRHFLCLVAVETGGIERTSRRMGSCSILRILDPLLDMAILDGPSSGYNRLTVNFFLDRLSLMSVVCRQKFLELHRSSRPHRHRHKCFVSERKAWNNVGNSSSRVDSRKKFAHVSSDLVTVLTDTGVSSTIVEPDSRQTLLHRLGFVACS